MKRLPCIAVLLGLPLLAMAAVTDDYARQWPLMLSRDDGGAYSVELNQDVYKTLQRADLGDFVVLDSNGTPLPTALVDPLQPLATSERRVPVPWFALPITDPGQAGGNGNWHLITAIDADGRLRRVDVQADGVFKTGRRPALLLDMSRVRDPLLALELGWQPIDALDLGYRVEASDDLENWHALQARGHLVDLRRAGKRLVNSRLELSGQHRASTRYLRLSPLRDDVSLVITTIEAVLPPPVANAPRWLSLQQRAGGDTGSKEQRVHEYDTGGRFPVRQVDVHQEGNHAVEWRVESRDGNDAPWRPRVGPWMAYQLTDAGRDSRSSARELPRQVRDRYWRLVSSSRSGTDAPTLRLGYHNETAVFLAQGKPPFRLVAGSVRQSREPAPLRQLVAEMQTRRAGHWQPSPAYLGKPGKLAGAAALVTARDWKTGLLWGVLVLGALVVAGFAASLLRSSKAP